VIDKCAIDNNEDNMNFVSYEVDISCNKCKTIEETNISNPNIGWTYDNVAQYHYKCPCGEKIVFYFEKIKREEQWGVEIGLESGNGRVCLSDRLD